MHESHLFKNLVRYLEKEERQSGLKVRKVHVSLSEFGGLSKGHFLEHFRAAVLGTKWEELKFSFKKIPFGPEFQITKIDFEQEVT